MPLFGAEVHVCLSVFPVESTPGPGCDNKMVPVVADQRSGREPCKLRGGVIEPYRIILVFITMEGFDGGKFEVF